MKGPFGILLIGGGLILLYGLFTGKINLGNANLSGNLVDKATSQAGLKPNIPGVGCTKNDQHAVAGSCQPDPHHCGDGMDWFQGKCVQIVG